MRPWLPFLAVSALLHGLVAWRLSGGLVGHWPMTAVLLCGLLAGSTVLIPWSVLGTRHRHDRLAQGFGWAGLLLMGWFSSVLVGTVLRELLLLTLTMLGWAGWSAAAAPGWSSGSALAVLLLSALATLVGLFNARRTAAVVRVDVPIADLPDALHGFTIAQISDIHVGPTIGAAYLRAIVQRVNRLQADLVAITGDLVDGSVEQLAVHVAPLAELQSRHGSYFVTGNHEYYSGAPAWIRHLRQLGVQVLLNEHVVIQHGRAAVVVAGVADHGAHHFEPGHRSDPHAALAGAPAHAGLRLLLAHQPRSALLAAGAGYDLQLSGHTHGGQFLPWKWFVPMQQPFTAGLHRLQDLWIYTSRGTGYWGPPKRLGAASEITHLRLVRPHRETT